MNGARPRTRTRPASTRAGVLALPALALTLGVLSLAPPAGAQGPKLLGVGVYGENDVGRSDSSYTQGARLQMLLALPPRWTADWQSLQDCSRLDELHQPCLLVTIALGQSIYTPGNIKTPELQPHSRPYAGWLYLAPGAQVLGQWTPLEDVRLLGRPVDFGAEFDLPMGVVGPRSLAEHAQSWAHWTFAHGAVRPKGWDHQLRGGFGINPRLGGSARLFEVCLFEGSLRDPCWEPRSRRLFDLIVSGEGAAGNIQTHGKWGATARIGWNLRGDLGPEVIPITRGRHDLAAPEPTGFRVGVVAAFHRKHVGYNRFVQGGGPDEGPGRWKDVRQIVLLPRVNERAVGFVLGVGSYNLAVQRVWRGAEFGFSADDRPDDRFRFTSVSVSRDLGAPRD
jgi:hypothetical protein